MKTPSLIAALVIFASAAPSLADEKYPPLNLPPRPVTAMDVEMETNMRLMREQMQAMQLQMVAIHKTTDVKERHRLLKEHVIALRENMKTLLTIGMPMMKSGGADGGIMVGGLNDRGGLTEAEMVKRHEMMERRMSVMLLAMEEMLQTSELCNQ